MKDEDEMFKKVFGESVEEALREMGEEGVGARARKVRAVPNKKEAECPVGMSRCCCRVGGGQQCASNLDASMCNSPEGPYCAAAAPEAARSWCKCASAAALLSHP